jgi:hypothetical protein
MYHLTNGTKYYMLRPRTCEVNLGSTTGCEDLGRRMENLRRRDRVAMNKFVTVGLACISDRCLPLWRPYAFPDLILPSGQSVAAFVRPRLCREWLWLPWLLAACSIPNADGQSLRVSPVTATAGEWVTIQIFFESAPDREPAALEWDTDIPSSQLELESERMARAPLLVKEAGKALACAVARRRADTQLLHCVLAGGLKSIPSGAIVLLTLKIPEKVQTGTARIRVEHALGVTRDLKELSIDPAEGAVNVRASR